MTKETLFVLCASFCLSFGTLNQADAQSSATRKEVRRASTVRTSADSVGGEKGLLADRLEIKRKIADQRRLREAEIKEELQEESLEYPAVDLYGENSWNSNVNPFSGDVEIPNTYDINLNEFVMPLAKRRVTSNFGYRRRFGRMHYGIDLGLSIGDTIRAAFSGRVRINSYEGRGYGHYVVIRHPNGLETVYGHNSRNLVREGTIVRAGDPIALGGNTGRSTGPHLHFEVRFMGIPMDPADLFDFDEGAPKMDVYTFRRGTYLAPSKQNSSIAAKSKKSRNSAAISTYRVRKGDTLYSIASKHGTTVKQLCKLNGISPKSKLQLGRSLRVS